ncbi:hypothetical protein AB0M28_11790 [Streptomyces sp. NPDC051940]|uniref:hypothetical protein n=1 Tax=Streptomyces sp. NPDC051940 TaxID=3155675 RepID=UPI003426078B
MRAPRTRAGDVAGYAVAVALLVGGGAVFTRAILTFNRGPALAVAAIVLVGWGVDRLLGRRGRAAQAEDDADAGTRSGDVPAGREYGTGDER